MQECCHRICQLFAGTESIQANARGGLYDPPSFFLVPPYQCFICHQGAPNPPTRGSKIKSLCKVVQTKRKQKVQVVIKFSQGMSSKELIIFSGIESHRTQMFKSTSFIETPQKPYMTVQVRGHLRKVFFSAETGAEKWTGQGCTRRH